MDRIREKDAVAMAVAICEEGKHEEGDCAETSGCEASTSTRALGTIYSIHR